MIVVYAVEVLKHDTWERWGWYLSKRLAEGVRVRREQEGLVARVQLVTMDYPPRNDEGALP